VICGFITEFSPFRKSNKYTKPQRGGIDMKVWKSKKDVDRPGIWVSEIVLRQCDKNREKKVKKLLSLLGEEFDAPIL